MRENFDAALKHLLAEEGGYVHHEKDPGGRTNHGVTQRVWEDWVGRPVDEATMRNLKQSDVAPLYRAKYWNTIRGDDLPAGIDLAVFDAAVNSGSFRAAKWLQEVVGATPDGAIGPATLAAIRKWPAKDVIDLFCARRLAFLQKLDNWGTFGRGWGARVHRVSFASRKMTETNYA